MKNKRKILDLSGRVFGALTVISRSSKNGNKRFWICKCICGKRKKVGHYNLLYANTKSCGDYNCQMRSGILPSTEKRFWENVRAGEGCWQWVGRLNPAGYGIISLNGRWRGAHRYSWSLHFGDIPAGIYVCHHCDNPACVNPKHLFLGKQSDNMADKVSKNRQIYGEQHYAAKLNTEKVKIIREKFLSKQSTQTELAEEFNVSLATICYVVRNKRWLHGIA